MSWLAFAASLIHSLAWPAAVTAVIIVLRRPISAALRRGVHSVRAGPVEVVFENELAEVREELRRSPELAARAASQFSAFPLLKEFRLRPTAALPASLSGELARLAEVSPRAAVLAAYERIEERLVQVLNNAGAEPSQAVGGRALARLARTHGLISDETLAAVDGLSVLRDLAAHSAADDIGVDRARDYLALADAVLYVLRAKTQADRPADPSS